MCLVSDLAPGQMGIDDMKMLEQKAQQLAAEAEQDRPKPKEKILFVRFVWVLYMCLCVFILNSCYIKNLKKVIKIKKSCGLYQI